MSIWDRWRADRRHQARAAAYVRTLAAEPDASDVAWLAEREPSGDADHARWELRYAKRAVGMLSARRDALDDRTGSLVSSAHALALAADPIVAVALRELVTRQMNARLALYDAALDDRRTTPDALGATLLELVGSSAPTPTDVTRATSIVARYLADANRSLRAIYGEADLPDDVVPSAAARRG